MNEYEITEARELAARLELKNLHRGACVLANLRDWVNQNSDGWPYWHKPYRASAPLQVELQEMRISYYQSREVVDLTDKELRKLLAPIKSFLTRQGVGHAEVFKP